MKQSDFEKQHEPLWQEVETLLASSKSSRSFFENLKEYQSLRQFPEAYHSLSHQLALAKQRRYSASLVARLNYIVTQAHNYYYGGLTRFKANFFYYAFIGFPVMLRKNARFFWTAMALFFLPGFLLFTLCLTQEELIYSFMSLEQVSQFESMYDSSNEDFGRDRDSGDDITMFCFYIMNNIGVSFRTFASGLLYGLGSIFFLVYNGVHIGAVAGHMAKVGYTDTFFPFVVGHGSFELIAIAIAGAAGLKLGWSLVSPGNFTRLAALKNAASEAIVIIYGSAAMLLIAAFVEAFWSSSSIVPISVKYLVGAFFWLIVIWYLARAGKRHAA